MRHSSTRCILALPGVAVAMAVALVGCGHSAPAPGCGQLTVHDAWVTPAHAGSREMLGYFTLHNDGSQSVTINGVASTAFDRAIFQNKAAARSSSNADGGARPLARFTLAGGASMQFKPGEREVALYSPTQAYRVGDQVPISLICGNQRARLATKASVRDRHDDLPAARNDENTAAVERVTRDRHERGAPAATNDSKSAN